MKKDIICTFAICFSVVKTYMRSICQRNVEIIPTAEILSGKNARAFLVSGFIKKYPENMKKNHGSRLEVTC